MRKNRIDANAYVPQKSSRELESRQKSAMVQISKLVNSGLISVEEVQKVQGQDTRTKGVICIEIHLKTTKR